MKGVFRSQPLSGFASETLAIKDQLAKGERVLFTLPNLVVSFAVGGSSLWIILRRPEGAGFVVRTAYGHGGSLEVDLDRKTRESATLQAKSSLGNYRVEVRLLDDKELLHIETSLTPARDLLVTTWPRDLYPIDADHAAHETYGEVHAAQRGLNGGFLLLSMPKPEFGTLLYMQDLTRLNPYFRATGSVPDGRVGGAWPELGYMPPLSVDEKPLPARQEVVISSAFIHMSPKMPERDVDLGRILLELVAGIYPHLERPQTEFFDWPKLARRSLRDIQRSPEAKVRHYGHTYMRPYTDAEYPDSMVQLAVLRPIAEYAQWQGKEEPFGKELWAGVDRFFDPTLKTLRRYLPNVGEDKDADKVDSWYLYHPLSNLGRLALAGHAEARVLFFNSLEYGIKAARHFNYRWPVFFDVKTLEVLQEEREPGMPGQSDVGGIYAYVMQQAYELSGDKRYLQEASKALLALKGLRFYLLYQANLTNLGAVACLRQWRHTGDLFFKDLSYLLLANGILNTVFWESEIGFAERYKVFLGATCLHDASYMAIYECYESSLAFIEYLKEGGINLPESVRLLLTEFCRYGLDRAKYFYPHILPKKALAEEIRNGHIDRKLAFPLEDLYAAGQPAGQVGQEVYGAGAAFHFAVAAFHRIEEAGVTLYCEAPLVEMSQVKGKATFRLGGTGQIQYRMRLLPLGRRKPKSVSLFAGDGQLLDSRKDDRAGHLVPGGSTCSLQWDD